MEIKIENYKNKIKLLKLNITNKEIYVNDQQKENEKITEKNKILQEKYNENKNNETMLKNDINTLNINLTSSNDNNKNLKSTNKQLSKEIEDKNEK